jgi:hypothetical protein
MGKALACAIRWPTLLETGVYPAALALDWLSPVLVLEFEAFLWDQAQAMGTRDRPTAPARPGKTDTSKGSSARSGENA